MVELVVLEESEVLDASLINPIQEENGRTKLGPTEILFFCSEWGGSFSCIQGARYQILISEFFVVTETIRIMSFLVHSFTMFTRMRPLNVLSGILM